MPCRRIVKANRTERKEPYSVEGLSTARALSGVFFRKIPGFGVFIRFHMGTMYDSWGTWLISRGTRFLLSLG